MTPWGCVHLLWCPVSVMLVPSVRYAGAQCALCWCPVCVMLVPRVRYAGA